MIDLSSGKDPSDETFLSVKTNIIPKQMTRAELLSGYRNLVQRVRDWHPFEARIKEMISGIRRQP